MTNRVLTPGGYRRASSVRLVAPGMRLATAHDAPALISGAGPRVAVSAIVSPDAPVNRDGWVAYAHWSNATGKPVCAYRATWEVPPPPATQSGQTIFLFNGIDPLAMRDGVLQPVLQWGTSGAGRQNAWCVASWYVNGKGQGFHTPLVPVKVGDVLSGSVILTDQRDGQFSYDCAFEGIAETRLGVSGIPELVFLNATLEAYNISKCTDYPAADRTTFRNIALTTKGGVSEIDWQIDGIKTECGQLARVVSKSASSGQIDIYYR